jgi:hypothetical protein
MVVRSADMAGKKTEHGYSLFLKINGKVELPYHPSSKKRLLALCRARKESKQGIYIKVSYGHNVHNDGTFYNYHDLCLALDSWTEPELLKFVKGGKWV